MATPGRVEDAILEYLRYYHFLHTAECLEAEREQKQLSIAAGVANRPEGDGVESLLQAFDAGDEEAFAYLWASVLPCEERDMLVGRRLEFNAKLHLAIFGQQGLGSGSDGDRRDPGLEATSRMEGFRQFLGGRGKRLSQETTCCTYFALPYCSDVASHPTFAALLEKEWVAEVRRELQVFVEANARAAKKPALCVAIEGGSGLGGTAGSFSPGASTARAEGGGGVELVKAIYAIAVHAVEGLAAVRRDPGQRIPDAFMNTLLRRMEAYGDVVEGSVPFTPKVLPSLDEFEPLAAYNNREEGKATEVGMEQQRGDDLEGKNEELDHADDFRGRSEFAGDPEVSVDDIFAEAKFEGEGDGDGDRGSECEGATHKKDNTGLSAGAIANLRLDAVVAATLPKAEPLVSPSSPQAPRIELGFLADVETPVLAPLDYRKLREDLCELEDLFLQGNPAAERQVCLVLQALRWRLSRTPGHARREAILSAMADADLLLINDAELPSQSLAARLLEPAVPPAIRLMTTRLISVVALSASGRAYLAHCASVLVPALLAVVDEGAWSSTAPAVATGKHRAGSRGDGCAASCGENGHGRSPAEAAACALQRLSIRGDAADVLAGLGAVESAVSMLGQGQARGRSRFANEQLAAMALNVALRSAGAERLQAPEQCAETVARVLADVALANLHEYMVGLLFALLKNAGVCAVLADPHSRLYKALKALLRADEHSDSERSSSEEEGGGEERTARGRGRRRRRRRQRRRLAPAVRKQLHYVVGVLDDGSVVEVLAQLRTEQKGKVGEEGEGEPVLDIDEVEEDIAPEEDEHEPEAFRAAAAPWMELRGERLLVTSYHRPRAAENEDDEEAKGAESKQQECKSPIMKLVMKSSSTVPVEFASNPLILYTPDASAPAATISGKGQLEHESEPEHKGDGEGDEIDHEEEREDEELEHVGERKQEEVEEGSPAAT